MPTTNPDALRTDERMQLGVLRQLLDWCVVEIKDRGEELHLWRNGCTGKHGSQQHCAVADAGVRIGVVCGKCKQADAKPPHTCPYKREINDSEALCNCCDTCRGDCSDDI